MNPRSALANTPLEGSFIRDCALTFKKDVEQINFRVEMLELTSNYPAKFARGTSIETKHNVWLRGLDAFVCEFEAYRTAGRLEEFKSTRLVPEKASISDEDLMRAMAELAQSRAFFINYMLGKRVIPIIQQLYFNRNPVENLQERINRQYRDRNNYGKKVVADFWGSQHSGNPLPSHRLSSSGGISAWKNWAHPVDVKLAALAPRAHVKDDKRKWTAREMQGLF
ncbi:uncharacterized protein F4807DRAFT_130859 [Annulohypoxylon truncatum]|uniref:uncharacterized protein n=1 Tax=Annulohypoxylon truncatum TaxID=327061 RepID=UPI002008E76B|nr:uncharacterized protein F4807DRAFT_130859 [Annulohypoxylon truncatum]KAI1208708.1 hypothetical protein F4807DRAFT_130859 [Annulohypoxylon truncatum]